MGCYYHQCFLRDLPQLTCLIRRTTTNDGRMRPNIEGEPNLYKIGKDHPLPRFLPMSSHFEPQGGDEDDAPSSGGKKRATSLDSSVKLTKHHVLSASSFTCGHEFAAPTDVTSWAPVSDHGRDGYYYHYPPSYDERGFSQHYPHYPPPPFPGGYGHWFPHVQPLNHPAFPDNGIADGGHLIDPYNMNQPQVQSHVGCAMFHESSLHHGTTACIDPGIDHFSYYMHEKESFDQSHFDDLYAPLPVDHHHEEKYSEGWIDGVMSVLKAEKGSITIE